MYLHLLILGPWVEVVEEEVTVHPSDDCIAILYEITKPSLNRIVVALPFTAGSFCYHGGCEVTPVKDIDESL